MVIEAFNYTVVNSYKLENQGFVDHYEETALSKFVLCPSGLGMDSYRIWETIILGSIPIVESNPGFDRFVALPVLYVKHLTEHTRTHTHTHTN